MAFDHRIEQLDLRAHVFKALQQDSSFQKLLNDYGVRLLDTIVEKNLDAFDYEYSIRTKVCLPNNDTITFNYRHILKPNYVRTSIGDVDYQYWSHLIHDYTHKLKHELIKKLEELEISKVKKMAPYDAFNNYATTTITSNTGTITGLTAPIWQPQILSGVSGYPAAATYVTHQEMQNSIVKEKYKKDAEKKAKAIQEQILSVQTKPKKKDHIELLKDRTRERIGSGIIDVQI